MSTFSISSRPSALPTRSCRAVSRRLRTGATTCQPSLRYSSAIASPRPREVPNSRRRFSGGEIGTQSVPLAEGRAAEPAPTPVRGPSSGYLRKGRRAPVGRRSYCVAPSSAAAGAGFAPAAAGNAAIRSGESCETERRGGSGTSVGIGCSGSNTWMAGGSSPPTLNRFFTKLLPLSATPPTNPSGDGDGEGLSAVAEARVTLLAGLDVSTTGTWATTGCGSAAALATLTTAGTGLPELSSTISRGPSTSASGRLASTLPANTGFCP